MTKKRLTKEQRQEIINSKLKNVELAEIYGISHKTVSGIRTRVNMGVGQSSGGNYRIDADKMAIILNPEIRIVDAFHETGVSRKHIAEVRKKNGIEGVRSIKRPMKPKGERVIKPKAKPEKPAKLAIRDDDAKMSKIKDVSLSVEQVSDKTGVSKNRVFQIRKELGIKHIKPVQTEKPLRDRRVKIQASMSADEQRYLIRKEAKEMQKKQVLTEAELIAAKTHKWVIRTNIYGKTERAFVKI